MKWNIEWSSEALRALNKLEISVARRIVKKIEQSSVDPLKYFSRLSGFDDYKLRVGDYRVIALLLRSKKTIFVENLGHRKNIYKKVK